jgi:predicted GNAT family N-acyltransferase
MNRARFHLRLASTDKDFSDLKWVREQVFIREQKVPVELEWDVRDREALHLLACDGDGNPIGTARLLPDGQIGRMAVVREWRCRGVGSAILSELLRLAESKGIDSLFLNAQTDAIAFYRRHGFFETGDLFMEAGISHIRMERDRK